VLKGFLSARTELSTTSHNLARAMLYSYSVYYPKESMKTRSIIAVEVSMALAGAAMIGLMFVVSFL